MNLVTKKGLKTLICEIPSQVSAVDDVCKRFRAMLQAYGLAEIGFAVELIARESLNNAIIHGNRGQSGKKVSLDFRIGHKWIRIQITDEGDGFNWRKASRASTADPTLTDGRGLAIGALYADRIAFNRKGNRVTLWLSKRRTSMSNFTIDKHNNQGLVTLKGDLTASMVPGLQSELKTLLEQGIVELVFDLGQTAMLDSSGIGLLIAAGNSVAGKNGKVNVINVCGDIEQLLCSMRLTERLNVSGRAAQEVNHG